MGETRGISSSNSVLDAVFRRLTPEHQRALSWFLDHQGEVRPRPKRSEVGLTLVAQRGIHKPAWTKGHGEYAISITHTKSASYDDFLSDTPNQDWVYTYHQHGFGEEYAQSRWNQGLVNCWKDRVPVGVFWQVKTTPNLYEVLGLGFIDQFDLRGFFTLHGPIQRDDRPGDWGGAEPLDELAGVLISGDDFDAQLAREDNRELVTRLAVQRQGQSEFRDDLLNVYRRKCAITDYSAEPALEAAHVLGYRGRASNHVKNGLLLRADMHRLFDRHLISIDDDMRVLVHPRLMETQYAEYVGRELRLPKDEQLWPSGDLLQQHRFRAAM